MIKARPSHEATNGEPNNYCHNDIICLEGKDVRLGMTLLTNCEP